MDGEWILLGSSKERLERSRICVIDLGLEAFNWIFTEGELLRYSLNEGIC